VQKLAQLLRALIQEDLCVQYAQQEERQYAQQATRNYNT
jgi:hypothetical protein